MDVDADGLRLAAKLLDPKQARSPEVQHLLDTVSAEVLFNADRSFRFWPDSAETSIRLRRIFAAGRRTSFGDFGDSVFRREYLARGLAYRGHVREAYRTTAGLTPERVRGRWFRGLGAARRCARRLGGVSLPALASRTRPGWPRASVVAARGDTASLARVPCAG